MSVYDCEPPHLDCDLPPLDEEISKRRDDFDIEDEEISSYSMNLNNEHSVVTTNAMHLYDSSPPPVDDFFISKNDYIDDLEIPQDESQEESLEKSITDDDYKFSDIPNVEEYPPTPQKDVNMKDIKEVLPNSSENVNNNNDNCETIVKNDTINDDLEVISINDGPNNDDKSKCKENINTFILEDFPEDDNYEDNKTNVEDCIDESQIKIQDSPKKEKEPEVESFPINDQDDDDDFDNFNDFEQAIPIDRQVDQKIHIEDQTSEIAEFQAFEADFSAFETNFDNEFQSFSQGQEENKLSTNVEKTDEKVIDDFNNDDNDDDDDFGDFNDFTQAPAFITTQQDPLSMEMPKESVQLTHETLQILNDTEVKTILGEMFPVNQQVTEESSIYSVVVKKEDDDVNILSDVESTLALSYEYKDSSTNHILIKALGIDERNILFGQQWASSNMPRFASDLSFNPLEPAKFTTSSTASYSKSNSSTNNNNVMPSKAKEVEPESIKELPQQPDIVPEFDWNVAGLTNPLDGKQNNTLKPNGEEPTVLSYDLSVFDNIPPKSSEPSSSDLDSSLNNKHLWQNERFDVPSTVVRERTIKLPETHIFTPVKSISPVAREVSRESSPTEIEKRSVVIKEYHDIEYSLETSKRNQSDSDFGDFNDFQSATTNTIPNKPPILVPTAAVTMLEPQKVNEINTKPLETSTSATINNFDTFVTNIPPTQISTSIKYDVFASLTKTLETAPLENKSIEDDFADFQAAPTILPQIQKPTVEKQLYKEDSSITLSPSRLVSNLQKMPEISQKTLSTWMNDTLDSDEISRIEAAFPKCKVDSNKKQTQQQIIEPQKDDDEWCDFQSVSQSSSNIISNSHTVPNQSSFINSTTGSKMSTNSDTSDWSDFVSVPVAKPPVNASQFLSKPNFSSWNQSMGKPYVNHTTSFLSSNNNYSTNNHYDPSFYSMNMPDNRKNNRQPMTITNNFNYNNFERQDVSNNVPPYQMSNGISTILPDLQFALPKTLVNLSRGNGSDATKK